MPAPETARRHGRDLIPQVGSLLKIAGLRAAGSRRSRRRASGPDRTRVCASASRAAKALAYASGARLIAFDSLEAIGRNAPAEAQRVSVIADAQRGEIYVADLYRPAPDAALVACGETHIEPIAEWLARLKSGVFVLGPACESPRIVAALPSGLAGAADTRNYPRG